ncbi:hypothetical protein MAM1_0001c00033 [Mucor ambiguus]|uniref:Uncharacterized protein n=1 Tax=Mucor ambiguus TaxID=91626 RepID=A0A0C9LZF9_9FUNG|nr:hypothetical protein MAM1_0001c00033 [Mucor ambiguus]
MPSQSRHYLSTHCTSTAYTLQKVNHQIEVPDGLYIILAQITNKRPLIQHELKLGALFIALQHVALRNESNDSLFSNRDILIDVISNILKGCGVRPSNLNLITQTKYSHCDTSLAENSTGKAARSGGKTWPADEVVF